MAGPFSGAFTATNCDTGTAIGTGTASDVKTLNDAGRYEFWAVAAANANNNAATSTCGDETVNVGLNSPQISTQVKNAGADGAVGGTGADADSNIADNASVSIGTKVFDTANVTGAATPTQTITYYMAGPFSGAFAATNCDTGTAIGTGTASDVKTLNDAGRYEFWAVAAANANNNAATSTCGDETVNVGLNSPQISTQVKNAGADGAVGGTGADADSNI